MTSSEIIKINKHNSDELYGYILSYILLKTGVPLSALSISRGLMECFNVQTSHVSVRNKLGDLVDGGDVFRLDREYLKPHYIEGKDRRAIDFGQMYYINLERNSFSSVYAHLKNFCNKSIPSRTHLEKRIELANALIKDNPEIKSGVIVHYYMGKSGIQKKKFSQIDFVIPKENEEKLVIITTNSKKLFSSQKGEIEKALIDAVYYMKKTKMANFMVVGFLEDVNNEELLKEFKNREIEYRYYQELL